MKVKAIIFDLGNTLVNFNHYLAVDKLINNCEKPKEEMFGLFFDSPLTYNYEIGKISSKQFYSEVKKLLGLKIGFTDFQGIWNEIFFPNRESEKLVLQLKKKYRMVLLSNINHMHWEYIRKRFPIVNEFEAVVLSFQVGARKPESKIYDAALEKAACRKDELVYVDDRQDLIEASACLGIPSILFKNAKQLREEFKQFGIILNGK